MMVRPEQNIDQQIEQLMNYAAQRGDVPIDVHQDFLLGVGSVVREVLGVTISFSGPLEGDSDVSVDPRLIDRAKKICSTCIVRRECLESAEISPTLPMGILGGKTSEERRPKWEERSNERVAQFDFIYKEAGRKLLALARKADDPNRLLDELARSNVRL